MIIIWRGWGILVPIICILGAVLSEYLFRPVGRMQSIYFFIPAVIVSLAGFLLDWKKQVNDFFFIPVKYWGIIVAIFGVVILFTG